MGFFHPGRGDLHERGLGAHLGDVVAAGIAHRGSKAADKLMHDTAERAFVGHAAFDAFRDQLLDFFRRVLEVAIGTALVAAHRAQRAHAAIGLERAALIQLDFARRFFGAGEHAADHHCVGARHKRLGQITRETDTTVGDQRDVRIGQGRRYVGHGRDLRHADARHDPRGADRARADADLDRINPGVHQRTSALGRAYVAADDLELRVMFLELSDGLQHARGMPMGRVDHDHVNTCLHQGRYALERIRARPDRRADAKRPVAVLAGVGKV